MAASGHGAGRAARRADPTGGLIARTRWRLALVTMGLLTVLLFGVGATTAVLALRALDDSVDHALDMAAGAEVNRLGGDASGGASGPSPSGTTGSASAGADGGETEQPQSTGSSGSPTGSGSSAGSPGLSGIGSASSGSGSSGSASGSSASGEPGTSGDSEQPDETPQATSAPTTRPTSGASSATGPAASRPTAAPKSAGGGTDNNADREPQAADTFFLSLDSGGNVLADPANVRLTGLPDAFAVSAAGGSGRDLRTVTAGGVHLRLLTLKLSDSGEQASGIAYLQAGFVLTLRDEQAGTLLRTIALVGLIGLAGAAALTFLITGRALIPIRSAFARERRFVATSSHELRTPIALIRSTAEVLDREDFIRPGGEPFVADILAEADRLGRLVADLSTLATAQAGPAPTPVPIDLAALAVDTVHRAGPMAAERGVVLEGPADPRPIRVMGQDDPLVQVALILIDNAVKVTPSGGRVDVSVDRRAGFGELIVEDEGVGVPEADRERIFEPFARLDGARRDDGGSGLGLAVARAIMGRLGGSIQVGSSPSGGARFVVSVPLA